MTEKYAGIGTTDLAVTIDWTRREIPLKLVSEVPGGSETK